MYDFHYSTWIHKFPNSTLLFTETDSLACEVVVHDLFAGMADTESENESESESERTDCY